MAKKILKLIRNLRNHQRFFHQHPPQGKVYCSRCADIWCRRNVTPTSLLPQKEGEKGKIRQNTCPEMIHDTSLPVDLGK